MFVHPEKGEHVTHASEGIGTAITANGEISRPSEQLEVITGGAWRFKKNVTVRFVISKNMHNMVSDIPPETREHFLSGHLDALTFFMNAFPASTSHSLTLMFSEPTSQDADRLPPGKLK